MGVRAGKLALAVERPPKRESLVAWLTVRLANGWSRAGPSQFAFGVDIPEDSRKTPLDDAGPALCEQLGPSMPHYPMSQPESFGAPPSWDQKSPDEARDPASVEYSRDVTEVARALAAHGGGAASLDLALDLVLNEVVEQARSATGAKGAAIAFAKGNEMVCRATTGDAPELGVRLETTTGLSGACLQTGTVQQCSDTETDPRVDAEDCRTLGVRSILMVPLSEGNETFGVFEVFSSRPNAFGDRDVNTLLALAPRVVTNKKGAEGVAAVIRNSGETSRSSPSVTQKALLEDDQVEPLDAANLSEEAPPRRKEVWTSILGVLVILVAVILGLALGWRAGIGWSVQGTGQQRAGASSTTSSKRGPDSAVAQKTAPVVSAATNQSNSVSQTRPANAATSAAPPDGGLQVTQNGKVIYRSLPAGQDATPAKRAEAHGAEDSSATRLIHRVEPVYPPEARAQQIQGAVTLDVQIGEEGAVHNIVVVEGNPVLADAAVQAVRQWRYRPYSVDGHPVEMQTRVTIRFTLPPT